MQLSLRLADSINSPYNRCQKDSRIGKLARQVQESIDQLDKELERSAYASMNTRRKNII